MRMLFLAKGEPRARLLTNRFREKLSTLGELEVVPRAENLPPREILRKIRSCDVLLTGWNCLPVPTEVAADPGRLRYICHLTGEMRWAIPLEIIRSSIPVTNWGDAPAGGVAEATVTLLLACLKNLSSHVMVRREGGWWRDCRTAGSLYELRVGLYGMGAIARNTVRLLRPFGPNLSFFDPFVKDDLLTGLPPLHRRGSLEELFSHADAIIVLAGLTPETRGSIQTRHLAMLPDHGIIVNTARGAIIEEESLMAELATGRLRAGIDVLIDDWIPEPNHPMRSWPNLILTGHCLSTAEWPEERAQWTTMHTVAFENLQRFIKGETLHFRMNEHRYHLST